MQIGFLLESGRCIPGDYVGNQIEVQDLGWCGDLWIFFTCKFACAWTFLFAGVEHIFI